MSRFRKALLFAALIFAAQTVPVRTQPATITVCASGCTYNNSQLQTAINAANAGDLILLQEGQTYTGAFTVPVKSGAGPAAITTLRTGVSASGVVQSTTRYPAPNKRICPSGFVQDWYDCSTRSPQDMTRIAKLAVSTDNTPVLKNANTAAGTPVTYWNFQWLEFVANVYGGNALIVWSNDTIDMDTGTSLMMPGNITMDQVVIRGLPASGQFRGVQADTRTFALTNSHIYDIKATGEGQAVWSNGVGPYTYTNNYVSGGTEVFFTGGSGTRPEPKLTIDASPTPTATTFTVTGPMTDMYVEKQIAVFFPTVSVTSISAASDAVVTTSSAHGMQVGWEVDFDGTTGCGTGSSELLSDYPIVVSVQSTTQFTISTNCTATGSGGTVEARFSEEITAISGNQITVNPALPSAPPSGSWLHTGMTIRSLTARYNVFTHPQSWFDVPRIVALPTGSQATGSTSGGSLAAGTYGYRVLARHRTAQNVWADSGAATEVTASVASGTSGSVTITWNAVPNATEYLVYGRTPGAQTGWWSSGSATTFTDTGSATGFTAASVDTSASRWQVKNTYELKQCMNCTIEYNLIEQAWLQGQTGSCVLFTITQQNNDNFSANMKHITFRYNEMRHCGQALQLTGADAGGDESAQARDITVSHNLWWDVAGNYNGSSPAIIWSHGGEKRQTPNRSPRDITFTHNTIAMDTSNDYTYAIFFAECQRTWSGNTASGSPSQNVVIRDNILYQGTYGVASEDPAQDCTWVRGRLVGSELTGTSVFDYNVLAGSNSCSVYTDDGTNNTCPTVADLEQNTFTGATNANRLNYRVKSTSPYYGTASDAINYGADITAINTAMVITESGDNSGSGGGAPDPLVITTTSPLTTAIAGQPYSQQICASGGTTPYTWAHTSGTLPSGMTVDLTDDLNPLCMTVLGVPSAATTNRSLTFSVTDAATPTSQQASRTFTISVERFTVRQSRYNWTWGAYFVQATEPTNPRDQVRFGDLWFDTATSLLKKAMDIGPPITWETVAGGAGDLSNLNASNLTSGTIPNGRFPATLPAASGANLTGLNAGNLATGTVPVARLGASGTASSSTFLRGDNTWATPAGGGSASPVSIAMNLGAALTTSNVPAGGSELGAASRYRMRFDSANYTQVSMFGYIASGCADDAGNANGITPVLELQYWDGSAWQQAGTSVSCLAAGLKDTVTFTTLVSGARANGTIFRLYWTDGDGVADPALNNWYVTFRP